MIYELFFTRRGWEGNIEQGGARLVKVYMKMSFVA